MAARTTRLTATRPRALWTGKGRKGFGVLSRTNQAGSRALPMLQSSLSLSQGTFRNHVTAGRETTETQQCNKLCSPPDRQRTAILAAAPKPGSLVTTPSQLQRLSAAAVPYLSALPRNLPAGRLSQTVNYAAFPFASCFLDSSHSPLPELFRFFIFLK